MNAHDALQIIRSWKLSPQDINRRSIHLTLDLTHGDFPLIIGFDVQQIFSRSFTSSQSKIYIELTNECDGRYNPIYISKGNTPQRRAEVDRIGLEPVPTG